MIPIGDDNVKGGYYPFFSYLIIIVNSIIFFAIEIPLMSNGGDSILQFFEKYAFKSCLIADFSSYYRHLSSVFLHGGIMHLLGNMIFLWIFGDNIEKTIGNFQFFIFYLLGGIFATYTEFFLNFNGQQECSKLVGASGAIAAVMGAYFVMFPLSRIKIWLILFFRVPAFLFLAIWFITQLTGVSSDLLGAEGNRVAYGAHLGGFIYGVVMGYFFKKGKSITREISKKGRKKIVKYNVS